MYSPEDVKHLEIMADLQSKKLNINDFSTLPEEEKSQSFEQTILSLCDGLRQAGFDKYADSLESKFVFFKKAETHLYRAHDEDGEDLIEFAHPDGDHNVEDGELGDVETIVSQHKKMVSIVGKKPSGKLATYVEQCKIVLADFLVQGDNEKLVSRFSHFARNFADILNQTIVMPLADEKYQNAKLVGGQQIKDFDTKQWVDMFISWSKQESNIINPETGDVSSEDLALPNTVDSADKIIKEIYDLIDQIDKTIDSGSTEFTSNYPDKVYAYLNPYREEFMSIFTELHNDKGASEWHGQFISTDVLSENISIIVNKLKSIQTRIDRHILHNPSFQSLPQLIAWFSDVKNNYLNGLIGNLNDLINVASKFIEEVIRLHRSNESLIDANKLREFLKQKNSNILSVENVNLSTNNANEFLQSLSALYINTLNLCKTSIQNAKIDDKIKSEILKHFEG